jgi:hypothetical protein
MPNVDATCTVNLRTFEQGMTGVDEDRSMTDNPLEQPESSRETWEASAEATERLMRLQVWLNGLLAGGPSLADAVKPWREGLPIYGRAAAKFAEDQNELPEDGVRLAEESLMAACRRIREGREQAGEPPLDICGDEPRRRLTEVLEEIQAGRRAGEEFTPMHVVFAARYVEGVIDSKEYRSRRQAIRTP